MIKVYHNKNFSSYRPYTENIITNSDLELVATVNTTDLETAFRLTNSIDGYWWENEGVEAHKTKTRSTSMGDVMVINNQSHVVDSCGFKQVDFS